MFVGLIFEIITITNKKYTHNKVYKYYQEAPYFTHVFQAELFESIKREAYRKKSGSLLFQFY